MLHTGAWGMQVLLLWSCKISGGPLSPAPPCRFGKGLQVTNAEGRECMCIFCQLNDSSARYVHDLCSLDKETEAQRDKSGKLFRVQISALCWICNFPFESWSMACSNECWLLSVPRRQSERVWLTQWCQSEGHNLHFNPMDVIKPTHTPFSLCLPLSIHISVV